MFKKLALLGLASLLGISFSVAQAATRTNGPLEIATLQDPANEKKCLEAFVESKFDFAQPFCLSLAQRGMRDAQLVTGLMYAFGEGIEKNKGLAILWLQEAKRNGSIEALEVLNDLNEEK